MGRYNPHVPQILGQEWVPIREDTLVLAPQVNLVEVGHKFTTSSSKILQTARFYVQEYPPGNPLGQVVLAAIYHQGTEALTGPVRSVVIPCSQGSVTGGTVDFTPASSIAEALANPSDNLSVFIGIGAGTPTISLRFDVDSYTPLLNGKRILNVDFLYAATVTLLPTNAFFATVSSTASTGIDIGSLVSNVNPNTGVAEDINRLVVGEVDHHWNAPVTNIIEVLPWSPQRLRGFDETSGLTNRLINLILLDAPTIDEFIFIEYAALEVFYCDETRLMYGGKRFTAGRGTYILGANQLTMRDLTGTANPTLAAGDYSLVLSSANQAVGNLCPYPQLNQIHQLYDIPTHLPVRTLRPFPIDEVAVGKTFEPEDTVLLPQLSLHTSGGPVTEVHVYGRQAAAKVYGTITATQEIMDSAAGGPASYPWVRYYARRFGDTAVPLKLDSPSITGSSVELTPDEFDELDEIVDGWKEVTLRFTVAPTMGSGTQPQWRWSATGELAGNRWEVLGAIAPALSGTTGNYFTAVPSPHQLSIATYGMPVSGAGINLGWVPQYAPPVSATVDDQTSDAVLIFAKDMPTVTGFSLEEQDQGIVGIGLDCGVDPCCVPSTITYNQLSWPLQGGASYILDNFNRTPVVSGWGTTTTGEVWTNDFGTPISQFYTNGTVGVHDHLAGGGLISALTVNLGDIDATVTVNVSAADSSADCALYGRYTDSNNYYRLAYNFTTGQFDIGKRVSSVSTTIAGPMNGPPVGSLSIKLRLQITGTTLRGKVWLASATEPEDWMATATDSSLSSGKIAVSSFNSTVAKTFTFDDLEVGPSDYLFGAYEIQRSDTLGDWQTIMRATSPAITAFNDYEARVGIETSYRIRAVDVYDFPGPWSTTITGMIDEPGVTIGCTGGHLLIFTSNEQQDGSLNLAYSSVWEGRVEENFAFAESQFVQLQAMYNRDFFTAFRPMERGGEQFSRTVLVQAAAISPETLGDFTSLRDMAWADVSYICVRDEDGNRWFATVLVPSGRVLRDRRLYMAPVDIIEVTDTPSEVNP